MIATRFGYACYDPATFELALDSSERTPTKPAPERSTESSVMNESSLEQTSQRSQAVRAVELHKRPLQRCWALFVERSCVNAVRSSD